MLKDFSEKLSYREAMERVEKIINSIEQEKTDVDELSDMVREASSLIAMCQEKLRKTEMEVKTVLKTSEEGDGMVVGQDEKEDISSRNGQDEFIFDDEDTEIPF